MALLAASSGHLVRYHGVLSPHSRWQEEVVRDRGEEKELPQAEVGRGPVAVPSDAPGSGLAVGIGELRADGKPTVRGAECPRTWCEVLVTFRWRDRALERLCAAMARPAFALSMEAKCSATAWLPWDTVLLVGVLVRPFLRVL